MTTTIEKEFCSLTVAERVNLVEELWERVAAEPEALPVPDWQIKELERRRRLVSGESAARHSVAAGQGADFETSCEAID